MAALSTISLSGGSALAEGGAAAAPQRIQPQDAQPIWSDRQQARRNRVGGQVERLRWQPQRVRTVSPPADAASSRQGRLRVSRAPDMKLDATPIAVSAASGGAAAISWSARGGASGQVGGAASDPFQDPFGDQLTQLQPDPPFRLNPPAGNAEQAPRPLDPQPEAGPAQELPMPYQDDNKFADCKRVYNDRNCCKDEDDCKRNKDLVQGDSIVNVILDITPRFKPDANDIDEEASQKADQLTKAGPRDWKNRQGKLLAYGHFTNFRDGRIIVTQEDGQLVEVPYGDLNDDAVCFVTAWWGLPMECTLSDKDFIARNWTPQTFTFKASGLCHKPLYFEETQLERYGHTMGPLVQPWVSGAHFFGSLVALPYSVGIHPLTECQYALGYYRPGNCAPWLLPPLPISLRGGLYAGGFYTGMPFIIP